MKIFAILLLACGAAWAQTPLTFTICSANCSSSSPLPSTYTFTDTPQGSETAIEIRPTNTTNAGIKIIDIQASDAQNFVLTNVPNLITIAPGQNGNPFFVHFVPRGTGSFTASLTVIYCHTDSSQNCLDNPAPTLTAGTLQGNGAAQQVTVTCSGVPACNGSLLYPETMLDFGDVTVGATASLTFTVSNGSQSSVSVSLVLPQFLVSPFTSDPASALPATVPANGTATFKVDFTPGQTVLSQVTGIAVGSSTFPLQGNGVASDADPFSSLVISYTDATGVRQIAQGKIDFGQVISGTSKTLSVSVCNPYSAFSAVSMPVPTLTGSGFSASGLPSAPVSIPPATNPNDCQTGAGPVKFQLAFTAPVAPGNAAGTLTIGTRSFTLTAQTVTPPLPSASFQLSQQPLASAQQVSLTVQFASPSQGEHIPTLTMTFVPSVQNVTKDPAIKFLATNTMQLNLHVADGAQTATYNNQSSIAFQTGTTAGTLTLTLTDVGVEIAKQSYTIPPDKVHITSATAVISSPNLVITISGYDNTYSTGQLSFTFYDTKGNIIDPGAMAVNATSQFQQYFFNNNQAGGAFAMQASFPVRNGDATQVGSVSITMNNSAGIATTTQTFQ